MTRAPALLAIAGVLALGVAAAPTALASDHGATRARAPQDSDLWATINICDTERFPDRVGVRASMPGGSGDRMYMRFRTQFFDEGRAAWASVSGSGVSPWIYAGSARAKSRQAGYTFAFDPPPEGGRFIVRGVVNFAWRERRRRAGRSRLVTVRRADQVTKTGFPAIDADPPGASSGVCELR